MVASVAFDRVSVVISRFWIGIGFDVDVGAFLVSCSVPVELERVDATHVRVLFSQPALVIPTLQQPTSFEIRRLDNNAQLTVYSVALGTVTAAPPGQLYASVTEVILTTSELGPVDYHGIAFGLEDA